MKLKEINEIFEKFSTVRALVIGDVMIDSYIWGKVERISPEAPVPVVTVSRRENRLGGAANVALNLQSLGATPILCSVIGNDEKGAAFIELLQQQNLSSMGIIKTENRKTTTKFRVIGNQTQMLRVDEETESDLNNEETARLFDTVKNLIETGRTDVIIFEDYDKGVITSPLIAEVTELAETKNIPVVADPKKKNFAEYKKITLFKPNLKELKEGLKLDFTPGNEDELEKAVDKLQLKSNIDYIMVTLSEAGLYISRKEKFTDIISGRHYIPAHVRNIADVSGAGDTVISVAALCLALNLDVFLLGSLSNLAGGLVCEEVGVVPVNKDKLIKEAVKIFD